MITTLVTAFVASLLGSFHCAAMCGGLVSFTCGASQRPVVEQVGYHAARLLAYSTLGAIAGYAGQTLNRSAFVLGWQGVAAWTAGVSMVVWAVIRLWPASLRLGQARFVRLARSPKPSRLSRWFVLLHRVPSGVRGALLGLTTAVIPCGWLYAFIATAAAQGNTLGGALLMATFASGSLPILVCVGSVTRRLNDKVRRFAPRLSAVVLLALGLTTVVLRTPISVAFSTPEQPVHHACH